MKHWIFDTESCGFTGATILIQYQILPSKTEKGTTEIVHNIFEEKVQVTLDLIDEMVKGLVIGFNLAHDYYHMARTLNILTLMKEEGHGQSIPTVELYQQIEQKYRDTTLPEEGKRSMYDLCFNPERSLDLMLYGRESVFQATMNQSPIFIKKIPTLLADKLIRYLEGNLEIESLYFSKKDGKPTWKIIELHKDTGRQVTPEEYSKHKENPDESTLKIDEDFVNLKLSFYPSTSLKMIAKHVLGYDVDEFTYDITKPKEIGCNPTGGNYYSPSKSFFNFHRDEPRAEDEDFDPDWVFDNYFDVNTDSILAEWIDMWSNDPRQLTYAKNDVVFTRAIYEYFIEKQPNLDELFQFDSESNPNAELDFDPTNSELAGMVGNLYWTGYSIDKTLVKTLYKEVLIKSIENNKRLMFNSPKKVLAYLHEVADDFQKVIVTSTDKETLKALIGLDSPIAERAKFVYDARRNELEKNLLEKLHETGRFHATYKVLGTKTNRMSGGSMMKSNGSINPQGIKKDSGIRACFTFKDYGQTLSGGDFSGFEISIMEAVYADPKLREDLVSGKKIHAIWGSFLYDKTYEEIMVTEHISANEPDGYYSRAKNSIFAQAYGAETQKIAEITGLSEEDVEKATEYFQKTYPKIAEAKNSVIDDFACMIQANGIGTKIVWTEPKKYVESFLGFRRYFTMEYSVIKTLFDLASNLPKDFDIPGLKIMRRDRLQNTMGATRSAIYGGAFGLQSSIIRAAGNHKIQSPGGQMTKELQLKMWNIQPKGVSEYHVKPMNIHDEVQVCVSDNGIDLPELIKAKDEYINYRTDLVPLIAMDWKDNAKNWKDSH